MADSYLRNLPVPFFSQRQNDYLWKERYLDQKQAEKAGKALYDIIPNKTPVSMDCRTCNITSVTMILKYLGLLEGREEKTPKDILIKYFNHSYDDLFNSSATYNVAALEDWANLKRIAEDVFGAKCELYGVGLTQQTNMDKIKEEIASGYPVCISIGVEKGKTNGHVIVIRGFIKYGSTEYIILNDPWGSIADLYSNLHITSSVYYGSYYYGRTDDDFSDGDNVVLKLTDFENNLVNKNDFHRVMFIHAPLWNYPDGSVDKSKENIYDKINFENGGYPITTDDLWHDGVHLKNINNVHSIGAGRLVVARNEKDINPYGNTSFLLLEHQVKINKKIENFYSLYMHLEKIDLKTQAENYFLKGELTPFNWINELFRYILPYNIVVANLNNYNEEEGLINSNYKDILVYEVKSEDGVLTVDKTKISTYKVGRRCLIKPLPIKNRKIFDALLDPEKYNTTEFNNFMLSSASYSLKQDTEYFRVFAKNGKLLAVKTAGKSSVSKKKDASAESVNNFEFFKLYEKLFKYYSLKIKELADGKVVDFIDKNSFENATDISYIKKVFEKLIDESVQNYSIHLRSIEINSSIKKYSNDILLNMIDTYYYSTVNSIDKNDFINFKNDYKKLSTKYIDNCKNELEKYLKELETINKNSSETELESSKDFLLILKETITNITDVCDDVEKYNATGTNTESVLSNFKIYLDRLTIAPFFKVNLLENLLISLMKIPKSQIKNMDYFKYEDKVISKNSNSILNLIINTFNDYIASYESSFFHSCEKEIEIGKNEVIGKAGQYISSVTNKINSDNLNLKSQIHFEIFSDKEIFKMKNSIQNNDSDLFCNPESCIKEIIKIIPEDLKKGCKYLNDNLLTHDEVINFYECDKKSPFLSEISCKHISEWSINAKNEKNLKKSGFFKHKYKTVTKNKEKNIIEIDEFFENIHKPYMWFNSSIFNEKQFKNDNAWYYHPLYFIEKLIEEDKK